MGSLFWWEVSLPGMAWSWVGFEVPLSPTILHSGCSLHFSLCQVTLVPPLDNSTQLFHSCPKAVIPRISDALRPSQQSFLSSTSPLLAALLLLRVLPAPRAFFAQALPPAKTQHAQGRASHV